MRELEKHGLFTLSDAENVFQVDQYRNGIYIWCIPTHSKRMKEPIRLSTFVPYNSPTKLNDIFTRLRFHKTVMNIEPLINV